MVDLYGGAGVPPDAAQRDQPAKRAEHHVMMMLPQVRCELFTCLRAL
jgi:hypothetical protein